jgi:hypothetical protein
MAEEKTPQQQVKEAVWWYTQVAVTLIAVLGAGFYVGYLRWGDAARLRKRVTQLEQNVVRLRNERENLGSQLALVTRDRDACRSTSDGAAAEPTPGENELDGITVE